MKISNQLLILASLLLAMFVSGCNEDVIWDVYPVNLSVEVMDAQGNNLLDPDVKGNIVGEALSLEYKGKTFDVMWDGLEPGYMDETKAYLARFYGIWRGPVSSGDPVSETNPRVLHIGELPGDENYDVTMPLKCKDKVFNIRVVNRYKTKLNGAPSVHTEIYLDGRKCDMPRIVL